MSNRICMNVPEAAPRRSGLRLRQPRRPAPRIWFQSLALQFLSCMIESLGHSMRLALRLTVVYTYRVVHGWPIIACRSASLLYMASSCVHHARKRCKVLCTVARGMEHSSDLQLASAPGACSPRPGHGRPRTSCSIWPAALLKSDCMHFYDVQSGHTQRSLDMESADCIPSRRAGAEQ